MYPDAYNISWEECNQKKSGSQELYLSIPFNENSLKPSDYEKRKATFQKLLVDYTKKFHIKHLYLHEKEREYCENLEEKKIWDTDFKINEIPEIPQGELPIKPILAGKKMQSLSEFLKNTKENVHNKELLRIMKETEKKKESGKDNSNVSKKMGISDRLFQMVKYINST